MRYFLTLPLAALALTAVPALAQDATAAPDAATTQTPPATEPVPEPTTAEPLATPPADAPATTEQSLPAPDATTAPTPPTATTALTAEQQASYDAWPAATKSYFDALTPARQQLFLRIGDADKAKLVALPAGQQESVWASLDKQAAAQATTSPTTN